MPEVIGIGAQVFAAQAKLLQLIQSRQYYPLGSAKPLQADVRLMAATNSDIERAVAKMLCVGFEGLSPPAEFLTLLRRGVSGIILFARNLGPPPQMATSQIIARSAAERRRGSA